MQRHPTPVDPDGWCDAGAGMSDCNRDLTGLTDAQRVLSGVEHLVFIFFVDDFALAQVRREFGRVEDPRELVPHAFHAVPELLAALLRPGGRGSGVLRRLLRILRPNRDTCRGPETLSQFSQHFKR